MTTDSECYLGDFYDEFAGDSTQWALSYYDDQYSEQDAITRSGIGLPDCGESEVCGDGNIVGDEQCDDGDTDDDDGCDSLCGIESGWQCEGEPSTCELIPTVCGDGNIEGAEVCDDGNVADGDGCDSTCAVEFHYDCDSEPSECDLLPDDLIVSTGVWKLLLGLLLPVLCYVLVERATSYLKDIMGY